MLEIQAKSKGSKVDEEDKEDLITRAKGMKKVDYREMEKEEFGLKEYFKHMTLKDSRTKFSILNQTTMTVKSHCMSDKNNAKLLWECPENDCPKLDSIPHIKTCKSYEEIRHKHNNLETEMDKIHYFQEVQEIISLRNEG